MRSDPCLRTLTLFVALALVSLSSLSQQAAAGPEIGFEADAVFPTGDFNNGHDVGFGFEGRAGFGLPGPVDLVFEGLFDWAKFAVTDFDASTKAIRVAGGVRAGVPVPFVPELFAHIGWGQATFEIGSSEASDSGFTWDVGLASDLVSMSVVSVGIHLSYKQIVLDGGNINWVGLGAHVVFGF